MGWSASRVGRADNHAKSASAHVLCGRSNSSPPGEARAGRTPRNSKSLITTSEAAPPSWRGLGEEEPRPSAGGWSARRVGSEDNHGKSAAHTLRAPWAVCWFSTGRCARRPHATEIETFGYDVLKPSPPTWRGVAEQKPRPTAWAWSASPVCCADNHAKSASAHVLCGRSDGYPRGEARVGYMPRNFKPMITAFRSHNRRPGAASVKSNLGQRRGDGVRAALAAKTTTPSPQRTRCVLRGRSPGSPRGEACAGRTPRNSKPSLRRFVAPPANLRGVSKAEPPPTAWGEARCEMAAMTTTPTPQHAVHAPWAVGWFSTWQSARGPNAAKFKNFGYGISKPQPPTWRGVGEEEPRPAAWGWSAPRVGREDSRGICLVVWL